MIIDLDTLFPQRLSPTDIVSYATDTFASVESKILHLFLLMLNAAMCLIARVLSTPPALMPLWW